MKWDRPNTGDTYMAQYSRLFSPLTIGSRTIKNRIVSSGHDTVMVDNGCVGKQLIAYHAARAQGGVGLIVVQVAGVHESARYTSHILMAIDDSCIAGYHELADVVHQSGTTIFGQLFHPGREVMESQDGSSPVAVAPSAVPNERFRVMPRALANFEIDEIIDGYAQAARRLERAGLDGVEIVASHGYLPAQFLNPVTNLRSDVYGGSPQRRMHFLLQVHRAVREAVSQNFVVGLRISLNEHDPAGLDEAIILDACVQLDRLGLTDYVSVTTGTSAGLVGSGHIAPEMHYANGYTAPLSARVKSLIKVPVLVAGRINQPQEAERILESNDADACVMTRALICDPQLPVLAQTGHDEDIRACIACNQACIGHFHMGFAISCIQHPETGRELLYGHRIRTGRSRRVVVVGGGPAGLKAAAVAAERGHDVTLYEASSQLGGQVLLAQLLPGREEFGGAAINLEREARNAGVKIHTKTPVDVALLRESAPEVVVVATGARPYHPVLEVMGNPNVLDAWQVLRHEVAPSGHVVVVDWRGDWIGIGVARLLATQGHRVTLCVNGYAAGETLQQYVRDVMLASLQRERIAVTPLVRLFGVDNDTVYLQHVLSEEPIEIGSVSALVLACGHESSNELLNALSDYPGEVRGIGDCLAPRSVEEAVLEGLVVSSNL
jgi:2,4-dienoyl-CoA reductase-like NADH-dependent reductase (Old Yellow Enzyme family)/thioredoxin reductase